MPFYTGTFLITACVQKYNISLSGDLLRMHFVREVLQERKCDIAPVTLNGKIVALSTKSDTPISPNSAPAMKSK